MDDFKYLEHVFVYFKTNINKIEQYQLKMGPDQANQGPKCLTFWWYFFRRFFQKVNCENKNLQTSKQHEKLHSMQRVKANLKVSSLLAIVY